MQDGKFHPHTQYQKGVSRKSRSLRVRYANEQGSSAQINQGIKDFASKIKQRHDQYKANQKAEFEREVTIRRKFEGKLIIAFRLGRSQGINNSRKMEKFIRTQIKDLPDDKETNKFVVRVLKDFIERERNFEKQTKGKSKEEKKALQDEFDNSLKKSKEIFESLQADEDKKFAQEEAKFKGQEKKKIEKMQEETRKKEQDAREAEQKVEEAEEELQNANKKAEQERKDVEEELEKAKEKAEQDAKEELQKAKEELRQAKSEKEEQDAKEESQKAEEELRQANQKAEQDAREAKQMANEAEQKAKEEVRQAEQIEKQAEQAEQKQQDFAQDVFEELKDEEQKIKTIDVTQEDVGFPSGII